MPRKDVSESDVAISFMLECIAEPGYSDHAVYFRNEQEPVIQLVIHGVDTGRAAFTLLEEYPVRPLQFNGSVENAV